MSFGGCVWLGLSILIFMAGLAWFFFISRNLSSTRRLTRLSLAVILSILCFHFSFPYLQELAASSGRQERTETAAGRDEQANAAVKPTALLETMQAFSLDADYGEIFNEHFSQYPFWLQAYMIILYSIAPIVGGAIIYDVMAGVSPYLRLLLARFRRLYVFSALNRRSLCLAESILKEDKKAAVLFSNCSGGDEDEIAEMKTAARSLKAVCIPESFLSCRGLSHGKEPVFFLMKEGENGNFDDLENLSELNAMLNSEKQPWPAPKGCHLFCFTNQVAEVDNIRAVKASYDEKYGEKKGNVRIHVVNDHAQTAISLMEEHPLFEALTDKKDGEPLKVLIIGCNPFSLEMFKTVFWCGQLLNHPLQMALVCLPEDEFENERDFEAWLNTQCPELLESCREQSGLLLRSFSGEYAPPYASVCFVRASLPQACHESFLTQKRIFQYGAAHETAFSQFDYFIPMPGKDGDTVQLTNSLWHNLAYLKMSGEPIRKKIIAAAIEDEQIANVMLLRYEKLKSQEDFAAFLNFGSVQDRFSWGNVVRDAFRAHRDAAQPGKMDLHSIPELDATKDDIYSEWSVQARNVHLAYKMFSVLHRPLARKDDPRGMLQDKIDYCLRIRQDAGLFDQISWLEHRRWNAFLRAQGFRQPPHLMDRLRDVRGDSLAQADWRALSLYAYKHVPSRLHPNLVEGRPEKREESPDLFDLAAKMRMLVDAKRNQPVSRHIKSYDAPDGENGPILTAEEVCTYLLGDEAGKEKQKANERWQRVLARYPEIQSIRRQPYAGAYYADDILRIAMAEAE